MTTTRVIEMKGLSITLRTVDQLAVVFGMAPAQVLAELVVEVAA